MTDQVLPLGDNKPNTLVEECALKRKHCHAQSATNVSTTVACCILIQLKQATENTDPCVVHLFCQQLTS